MVNNPTVDTLLKYAYERERSIADYKEPNDFYIETELDKAKLKEAIIAGDYDLVFLVGTPGSGKSEFLHALNREIKTKQLDGFIIRHDATHVDGEKASAVEELKKLLSDYENDKINRTQPPHESSGRDSCGYLSVRQAGTQITIFYI